MDDELTFIIKLLKDFVFNLMLSNEFNIICIIVPFQK